MKRAILFLALGVPTSLAAQSATTTVVSSYVAADAGVSSGALLMGVNVTREQGWTGMRVGAAVDAGSTFGASSGGSAGRVGVLSADVDAMLNLGKLLEGGAVAPYLLGGVGGRMLTGASTGAALTWGYGAGARSPISDRLNLEAEIRYREPVGKLDVNAGQSAGMEYRFGASVRLGGGSARPRIPAASPFPRSAGPITTASTMGSATAAARRRIAERALDTADDYLGVPYTWGGNTPQQGFDCSGFVKYVFASQGIELPRVSRDQARVGIPLPLDLAALEPGDLIAFAPEEGSTVDHIAIYVGNGRIIHSSSSGRGVRFDDLYSARGRWYREHMVAARRVIDAGVFFAAE